MANDGRCACGCRIFFDLDARITCEDGRAFGIPDIQLAVCVSCESRVKIVGGDGERKTVVPFRGGPAAEKELFLLAIGGWQNDHPTAPNKDFITCSEADQKDYERHGIPRPEAATK